MPMPLATMTHAAARALATRLGRRGTEMKLAEEVAVLETEARTAGRLIKALLRQPHESDVFQLPPEA
jgi:hypothetical protein